MTTPNALPLITALRAALGQVYDPEFGISVIDMGLVYDVTVNPTGGVVVIMTLTSPYCPAGEVILAGVKAATESVAGVASVDVRLVWEPTWTPDRLSPEARSQLGWDDSQADAPGLPDSGAKEPELDAGQGAAGGLDYTHRQKPFRP